MSNKPEELRCTKVVSIMSNKPEELRCTKVVSIMSNKFDLLLLSYSLSVNLSSDCICFNTYIFVNFYLSDWITFKLLISNVLGLYVVNAYSITSPRKVSIQVPPVSYQSQPGHDPNGYNRGTTKVTSTGRDLVIYRCLNNI